MPFPATPALTTDCVVFDERGYVLLIRRKYEPFKGVIRAPRRLRRRRRTVEDGCRRELKEETGLEVGALRLVGVYSDPNRDPRGHTCSIAYLARVGRAEPQAGDDAAAAEWVADWRAETLAFDHAQILADAEKLLKRPSLPLRASARAAEVFRHTGVEAGHLHADVAEQEAAELFLVIGIVADRGE